MLSLTIPGEEHFDNEKQEFLTLGDIVVEMEHSLVSLSKWESKFEKPFLSDDEKTNEELFSYIQTMCLTPNVPPEAWGRLGENELIAINEYINARMTATWFLETPQRGGKQVITNEVIYHWMIALSIPMECERWHLNRLFTLIRVCNEKSQKPKKMTAQEIAARNRELNEKRKAEMGTRG